MQIFAKWPGNYGNFPADEETAVPRLFDFGLFPPLRETRLAVTLLRLLPKMKNILFHMKQQGEHHVYP
jgi:hypothetical protein